MWDLAATNVQKLTCSPHLFSNQQQKKNNEESEVKKKREVNLVISHAPSADNSNLSADGDDSFISVEMDSAMPSPFSEVSDPGGNIEGRGCPFMEEEGNTGYDCALWYRGW